MKKVIKKVLKRFIPKSISSEYISQGRNSAFNGNNFYCPCCEGHFKVFLPTGLKLRFNALCPGCGSLERHRLLWLYLKKGTQFFDKDGSLFHVAPENLFFRKFSKMKKIEYIPCAKFGKGYEDSYLKGTKNIDITNIPFDRDRFDYIICSHVLEHIPDDNKAMRELYRVLKPGGWAILQVPIDNGRDLTFEDFSVTDPQDRERLFGQKDHVRVYGKDYINRLQDAGFHVKIDQFARQLEVSEALRLGINPVEDIYLCVKSN